MEEKYRRRLSNLFSIQGLWQLFGGIGLVIFAFSMGGKKNEPVSCDACLGAGIIIFSLLGIFLTVYSLLFLVAAWTTKKSSASAIVWSILACIAASIQTLYATPVIIGGIFDKNSELSFLIPIILCLTFPFYAVTAIYGWWIIFTKNKTAATNNDLK